jgi:hypothetical protein
MEKRKVYIASPYTIGDTAVNVRKQMDCATLLMDIGFIPFAPLLTHFLHLVNPRPYATWMEYDFEWVKACDFLLRLQGQSSGADREILVSESNDIPIIRDIEVLLKHITIKDDSNYSVDGIIRKFDEINKSGV